MKRKSRIAQMVNSVDQQKASGSRSELETQPHHKVAKDLVFAVPILSLRGVSEKGTQLMLAQTEIAKGKNLQHVFLAHVERNFDLAENQVVVDGFFSYR